MSIILSNLKIFLNKCRTNAKIAFGILEFICLVVLLLLSWIFKIFNLKLTLFFSFIGIIIIGLMLSNFSIKASWSSAKEFISNVVIFYSCFILELCTTYVLTFLLCFLLQTGKEAIFEMIWRLSLFLPTIILFCIFRQPDQKQYILYAFAYLMAVVLQWSMDFGLNRFTNMKFAIVNFLDPVKEAMLLFIILDVYLTARKNAKEKGPIRKEAKMK